MRTASFLLLALALVGAPAFVSAQDYAVVHDRTRGELSQGARAPTRAAMMSTLAQGSPSAIASVLEYGERVECHACVPVLESYLLDHPNADVRRMAAWWLRRRPFAVGAIMAHMRTALATDPSPTRRANAAEAIGELMDPNGLGALVTAANTDTEGSVRAAAVRGLGRLNHPGGIETLATALEDDSVLVRRAAIAVVLRVNFFRDFDALVGALDDDDAQVRKRAAYVIGELRGAEASLAVSALAALLASDPSRDVRQASAWALGRIGGANALAALTSAQSTESDALVRDAIRVALAM